MNALARPVAMIDSGLGGLSVYSALRRARPDIDVVYFADTARVPYGDRPLGHVATFGQEIIEHVRSYDPALLIVASGTTCAAFEIVPPDTRGIAMLGVVASGARSAARASASGRIGVIATAGTIASGIFERRLSRERAGAQITSVGAPRLVPLVEAGEWASAQAQAAVDEYCETFRAAGCDAVILGCTHFPHLQRWFERSLGPRVAIVDPADACATAAAQILLGVKPGEATLTFLVSGDAEEFDRRAYDLAQTRAVVTRHVDVSAQMEEPKNDDR